MAIAIAELTEGKIADVCERICAAQPDLFEIWRDEDTGQCCLAHDGMPISTPWGLYGFYSMLCGDVAAGLGQFARTLDAVGHISPVTIQTVAPAIIGWAPFFPEAMQAKWVDLWD